MYESENFQELFTSIHNLWRKRGDFYVGKKQILRSNKIPAAIEDVINILWKDKDLKPWMVKKEFSKEKNKWTFIIHLPPGITYRNFLSHEEYFKDATKRPVLIQNKGGVVVMEVLNEQLKKGTEYKFTFNPEDYPKMLIPVAIGQSISGLLVKDMTDFYSVLIGGIPNSGKSVFIHFLLTSILLGSHHTCFPVIMDFGKKGAEFPYMNQDRGLLITDADEAHRTLVKLKKLLDKRNIMLRNKGKVKIHNLSPNQRPSFILLVIDELTEMQDKETQLLYNKVVRIGRNAGLLGVYCTQRPSAKTFRDGTFTETRALCDARLCFRVKSGRDSEMILDNSNGARLPAIPGRGIFQWDQELEIQVPFIDPETDVEHILQKGGVSPVEPIIFNQPTRKMLPPRQSHFRESRKV